MITFAIKVTNQGNVDATQIGVVDYVPAGLTLSDSRWTFAGGKATLGTKLALLRAGRDTTVNITFMVDAAATPGVKLNKAEISEAKDGRGDPATDVDSTPDAVDQDRFVTDNDITGDGKNGGDEDDHDPAEFTVTPRPVFDLALLKSLKAGQSGVVVPGGSVTFTIEVKNQGNVRATAVRVTDYIPAGLTLNDANWNLVGGNAVLRTAIASIAAGASAFVDITFTVNASAAEGQITNIAEITDAKDPDGNPVTDIDSNQHC